MRVVCNTSPLILLAKIQRIDLLIQLYDEIIVPEAVLDEICSKSTWETDPIRSLLEGRKFHRRNTSEETLAKLSPDLGHGEERGLIHSLRNELDRLIEAGMWISEIFYNRVLLEFGE